MDVSSSAAAAAAPLPNMHLLTGCMLIGVFMNVFLFGMSVVQGYIYFVSFKADKLFMKAFVAALLVADTLNCILDCGFIYQYTVSYFGNYEYGEYMNLAGPSRNSVSLTACFPYAQLESQMLCSRPTPS